MKVAAAVAVLALVLTGCSSSEGSDDPAASAAPGQDVSEPASETPVEPTESATPTPTVQPATGPVLDVDGYSVRLPEGWRVRYDTAVSGAALGKQGLIFMSLFAGPERPLRALIQEDLRLSSPVERFRRLEDTTLGGSPAYHYTGRAGAINRRDSFGAWDDGNEVMVQFNLRAALSRAERREIVESVLVTYAS